MSVSGDPAKFGRRIAEARMAEIEKEVNESLAAAEKLVTTSYQSAAERIRREVEAIRSDARERLRSAEAEADLRVKMAVEDVKSRAISDVIAEAVKALRNDRGEWYVEFLRRALKVVASEARERGKFVVKCNKTDLELVSRLVKEYEGLELSSEAIEIIGGVVAVSEDGSMTIDLSLDRLISENEASLRGVASSALFGV